MDKDTIIKDTELKNTKKKKPTTEAKKLKEELLKLKKENQELSDKYIRINAEFDNYKKRTDKEFLAIIQNASEKLITDLLPIVDDMERSLNHLNEKNDFKALVNGFELIYKNLISVLEKQGLKTLQSVGEEFDPEKHDALLQVKKDKVESNRVVDEHLKGYLLNDKVIRHAQVIVSK